MSMASVISPMPGPPAAKAPLSMTSKEWVIPPRPKPGRKPATDTPPTKRKAQNRAAQRAFRERRAARVGELEEQLDAEREEHDRALQGMQDKVHRMEVDAQALRSRCEVLENMLDKERAERAKEVELLRRRLHEAQTQSQGQHPRQHSLPSLASVSSLTQHTYAPQPLRHHRPSVPSRFASDSRASRASTSSQASTRHATTPTSHRPATTNSFSISQIISPPEDIEQAPTNCGSCDPSEGCECAEEALANIPVGCGNCTLGSRCQCLEEVLSGVNDNEGHAESRTNSMSGGPQQTTSRTAKRTIRSVSPSSMAPEEKRLRGLPTLATETDFTAMFSRQNKRPSTAALPTPGPYDSMGTPHSNAPSPYTLAPIEAQVAAASPAPEDRCGFCDDGTYCVCAEAAANAALPPQNEGITLPSIDSSRFSVQQSRTPPPSEDDAIGYEILPDGAVKLPSLKGLSSRNKAAASSSKTQAKPSGGCGPGGPGTCAQCIADPKSGLFCRSLAASFKKGESSGGCCGGGGRSGGGCCKDKSATATASPSTTNSTAVKLSCAEAYKTLSSHRHFNDAADDINAWLPLLRAAPAKPREPEVRGGPPSRGGNSRTPIEVEAASIMSVLKGFDVRFGRGE
ncbi:hypothetical protein VPNG_02476 [Cytospora leucostoma]|uniref:BZIP domain-containing protein n=1 Tax=Cytospora leucostoma TaxID=1230097 RepID=A0A423XI76_9PEZI|nr:hypothetical protein VPNG_02476 [Cytospora leucostoma]